MFRKTKEERDQCHKKFKSVRIHKARAHRTNGAIVVSNGPSKNGHSPTVVDEIEVILNSYWAGLTIEKKLSLISARPRVQGGAGFLRWNAPVQGHGEGD